MSTAVITLHQPVSWKQRLLYYVNQIADTILSRGKFEAGFIKRFHQTEATPKRINADAVESIENIRIADARQNVATTENITTDDTVNAKAAQLLDDYGNSILRIGYSYLQNMDDAEEILQETLIQFLTKAPEFENAEHEKAWLLHVAANISKNRIKYNRLRKTDELEETLIAEEKEDLSFVWEAVKSLPEKYREVIHLHYYEGYKTAQIAQILNRREATVRSDLRRGRERLKLILKEAYDFE